MLWGPHAQVWWCHQCVGLVVHVLVASGMRASPSGRPELRIALTPGGTPSGLGWHLVLWRGRGLLLGGGSVDGEARMVCLGDLGQPRLVRVDGQPGAG